MQVQQPDKADPGFIVMATYTSGGFGQNPMALIFDNDADLVWGAQSSLADSTRARMSYDGKWMAIISSNNMGNAGGIDLFSMDGDASKNKKFNENAAAHDLTPNEDNKFAFMEYVPGQAGMAYTTGCAKVKEIDLDGNTSLIYDTAEVWGSNCHGNALRYSADDGLYSVSDYEHNEIAVFDKSGNLQWVTQNNGTWNKQHGHQLLAGNKILIFNNGGDFSNPNLQSTALEFSYDGSGNLTKSWEYTSSGLGTPTLGDIQRLPNGNTLVAYSNKAIVHEVDPSGGLVRSWDFGQTAFGYIVWRPTLYGPPIDLEM